MSNLLASIFSGLGAMFAWGTGDVFIKKATEKMGSFGTFVWVQIIGLMLSTILFLSVKPEINSSISMIVLLVISAVSGTAAYLLIFKAFEVGNVSVISPINSAYTIFTLPVAYFVLKQTVGPFQLLAVLLVIVGVIIVSLDLKELRKGNLDLRAGVKEILFGIVVIGVIIVPLDSYILNNANWVFVSLVQKVLRSIFALILLVVIYKKQEERKILRTMTVPVFLVAFLDFIAISFYQFGLSIGNVIIVAPISSGFSIVTVILSVIFLKEKISLTQLLGIALTVGGIIILSIIS